MRYATMNYLKIGKATDLTGNNRKLYRLLEILVGFLSWGTLIGLLILSYLNPILASYFIIAFDIYWLLLISYLTLHLLSCYKKLQKNLKIDWMEKCKNLKQKNVGEKKCLLKQGIEWNDIIHLVIFPTYNESLEFKVVKSFKIGDPDSVVVTIPAAIREKLKLADGAHFKVYTDKKSRIIYELVL